MKEKGQALIEFVLILPVVLLIFVSLIDIGNIFLAKYNLNSDLETIAEMYQNDKTKEAKAYAAKEDLSLEEKDTDDMITLKISKQIKISAPGLTKVLGKNYKINADKTFYKNRSNHE